MDKVFNFKSEKIYSFKKRVMLEFKKALYISILLFIVFLIIKDVLFAILFTAFIILTQYLFVHHFCRYYVTKITLVNDIVEIEYLDKDKLKKTRGDYSDFLIIKKIYRYKLLGPPYLLFKFKNKTLIIQHWIGEWTPELMLKVTKSLYPKTKAKWHLHW